jgi:hypothetical protein
MLVAVSMIAAFTIPFVGTASASCTYSMTNVQTVSANSANTIGALEAQLDTASFESINGSSTTGAVYM